MGWQQEPTVEVLKQARYVNDQDVPGQGGEWTVFDFMFPRCLVDRKDLRRDPGVRHAAGPPPPKLRPPSKSRRPTRPSSTYIVQHTERLINQTRYRQNRRIRPYL
ncbi:hypothetical protein PGT21_010143 [Puccinia graminis f. sp. tritici]|uniref:Uncharacterized protein n=1 Tax=Puccinia graminis f. sp. tritici TaxID=56615 RepID=A0A5B0NKE4_PUCGR|nr:hypothetical protein PGT21_010143 [Puccinia graminis f. sp. tritici]